MSIQALLYESHNFASHGITSLKALSILYHNNPTTKHKIYAFLELPFKVSVHILF